MKIMKVIKCIGFIAGLLVILFLIGCWHNSYMQNRAKETARRILSDKYNAVFEIEETVYHKWTVSRDDCVQKYSRDSYRMQAYFIENPDNKFWIVLDKKLGYVADEYK